MKQSRNWFTVLFVVLMVVAVVFLYGINQDIEIRIAGTIAMFFFMMVWYCFLQQPKQKIYESKIQKIVLLTQQAETEKEWYCQGTSSLLIGTKNTAEINLSDTTFSAYIAPEHAVLNFTEGYWYLEDLSSLNGVGLKKRGDVYALKLRPMTSYKIDQGDVIYIAKQKLFVC